MIFTKINAWTKTISNIIFSKLIHTTWSTEAKHTITQLFKLTIDNSLAHTLLRILILTMTKHNCYCFNFNWQHAHTHNCFFDGSWHNTNQYAFLQWSHSTCRLSSSKAKQHDGQFETHTHTHTHLCEYHNHSWHKHTMKMFIFIETHDWLNSSISYDCNRYINSHTHKQHIGNYKRNIRCFHIHNEQQLQRTLTNTQLINTVDTY